ncbi:MAG: VWA domain-containing protein [Acidobacteriota bacterium]|nr:VWA domain-containing protein [Acidobacteriota bacterium]
MLRRLILVALFVQSVLGISSSAVEAEDWVDVVVVSPPCCEPVFGPVEVAAVLDSTEGVPLVVEFHVDGELVAALTQPPYKLIVDVGDENRRHVFRVRARGSTGAVGESSVETPAIVINEDVTVPLQQLYVTVHDGERRRLDLEQDDFEIFDNRTSQKIVTFGPGDLPLTAVVLLDASMSMRGRRLRFAVEAAQEFGEGLKSEDEASVQLFSDRLLFSSPFANDPEQLTAALAVVKADGGTALYDHLYRALKMLEERQGRRVVVFLSDGVDSHSVIRMPELAWLARQSRATIYWIRIDPSDGRELRFSAWKNPSIYRRDYGLLGTMVEESGGRIKTLEGIEEAGSAMRGILTELREQYAIGYYPSIQSDDGSWHRIGVRISEPGLQVRARKGYIDY